MLTTVQRAVFAFLAKGAWTPLGGPAIDGFLVSAPLARALAQSFQIESADDAAVHLQQSFAREPRKKPADGFQLEAQVVPDVRARHPQHEFVRRETARAMPLGEVDEERRDALLAAKPSKR